MMAMNISPRAVVRVINGGKLSQATVSKLETVPVEDERRLKLSHEAARICGMIDTYFGNATPEESSGVHSPHRFSGAIDRKALAEYAEFNKAQKIGSDFDRVVRGMRVLGPKPRVKGRGKT